MTAKEKAIELVDIYYQLAESIEWTDKETMQKAELLNDELGEDVLFYWHELAKQSALIAIDEAMLMLPYTDINTTLGKFCIKQYEYLEQVRHEIKKL